MGHDVLAAAGQTAVGVPLLPTEERLLRDFEIARIEREALIPADRCAVLIQAMDSAPQCGPERARSVVAAVLSQFPGDVLHRQGALGDDVVRGFVASCVGMVAPMPWDLARELHRSVRVLHAGAFAPNAGQLHRIIDAVMAPRGRMRLVLQAMQREEARRARVAEEARAVERGKRAVAEAGGVRAWFAKELGEGSEAMAFYDRLTGGAGGSSGEMVPAVKRMNDHGEEG